MHSPMPEAILCADTASQRGGSRRAAPAASCFFYSARSRREIAAKAAAQQNADSHFLHGKWAESTAIFVDWRLQRAEKEAPVVGITPWPQGLKAA